MAKARHRGKIVATVDAVPRPAAAGRVATPARLFARGLSCEERIDAFGRILGSSRP